MTDWLVNEGQWASPAMGGELAIGRPLANRVEGNVSLPQMLALFGLRL
jgi:hypothetical protein